MRKWKVLATNATILYDSKNLTKHINAVHMNLKPYACNSCPATFSIKSYLTVHTKRVHKVKWQMTVIELIFLMSQRINFGNVLWLTVRLCRTFRTLFHSTRVKTNHLLIRVGNPDEWCTQNSQPQDCLLVGISEVGNPEGNQCISQPKKWG